MPRQISGRPDGSNPLIYTGSVPNMITAPRRPTVQDGLNWPLGYWWIIPKDDTFTTGEVWTLVSVAQSVATWKKLAAHNIIPPITGSWTPSLNFGGSSTGITYVTQQGFYSQIENLVFISMTIGLSNKGSSTGVVTITGLPVSAGSNDPVFTYPVYTNQITYTGTSIVAYQNSNMIELFSTQSTTGVVTQLTDANFVNASTLILSGSYLVV